MLKFLFDKWIETGITKFLSEYDSSTLLECCKDIDDLKDMTPSELAEITKQEMIDAIKTNINSFGLNHIFSLFQLDELQEFCQQLNLKCDETSSKDILIDSIIENSNYKKPKAKKKDHPKPSKKKPEIEEGIKKVDLGHWFNKDELSEWLKIKGCKTSGKKKCFRKQNHILLEWRS